MPPNMNSFQNSRRISEPFIISPIDWESPDTSQGLLGKLDYGMDVASNMFQREASGFDNHTSKRCPKYVAVCVVVSTSSWCTILTRKTWDVYGSKWLTPIFDHRQEKTFKIVTAQDPQLIYIYIYVCVCVNIMLYNIRPSGNLMKKSAKISHQHLECSHTGIPCFPLSLRFLGQRHLHVGTKALHARHVKSLAGEVLDKAMETNMEFCQILFITYMPFGATKNNYMFKIVHGSLPGYPHVFYQKSFHHG